MAFTETGYVRPSLLEEPSSTDAVPTAPVQPGDVLAGKYRVERVLGAGGMGIVVAATHVDLDQRVALKFLLPNALANAEVVKRFAREARAAVKIKSEHVARVIDVGTLESGAPYIVMEYLEGRDLAAVLAEQTRMPVEAAVSAVMEACEALSEAHALGIVHRDLKPANLFSATQPGGRSVIKVLDFGISKTTGPMSEAALTRTAAIMGSPFYMSPEQLTAAKLVDARSDIWSIGVVLFELVVGRPPFVADTMPELIAAILQAAAPTPSGTAVPVPAGFDDVILRCLQKDPARRYATVADLARELVPFGSSEARRSYERISSVLGVHAAPAPAYAPLAPHPESLRPADPAWGSATRGEHAKPRRGKLVAAIVGCFVVLAFAAATLLSRSGSSPPTSRGHEQGARAAAGNPAALAPEPAAMAGRIAVESASVVPAPAASAVRSGRIAVSASQRAAAHDVPSAAPHAVSPQQSDATNPIEMKWK